MKKTFVRLLLIAVGVTLLTGVAVQVAVASDLISREEAAARAQSRINGRILSIKLQREPPPPVYKVKVLKDGDVQVLDVDARRSGGGGYARPGR